MQAHRFASQDFFNVKYIFWCICIKKHSFYSFFVDHLRPRRHQKRKDQRWAATQGRITGDPMTRSPSSCFPGMALTQLRRGTLCHRELFYVRMVRSCMRTRRFFKPEVSTFPDRYQGFNYTFMVHKHSAQYQLNCHDFIELLSGESNTWHWVIAFCIVEKGQQKNYEKNYFVKHYYYNTLIQEKREISYLCLF